ncbi:plasmid pRiA4b ORF-3 family protein [Clostridium frigoris]|uniref:Plasmid pRiA4b ORF-3 family protein n=1 Tax=Clostridium frigoris TaxID=205327 RepID=A0ABS6BTM6_9CLOT|nr:plasmid pRiA4b ORF-3 family protein [Clostridium frigoris]MBU3159870.1 plasmid pRiA4b ORF-3 family protein [Clostridium frigoris]
MKILKLKIILDEIKPEIYREVLIEKEATFHDLHLVIQKVFGWEDYHLYDFTVDDKRIGLEEIDESGETDYDSNDTVIFSDKKSFSYEYDFGDGWCHTIKIIEELDADPNMNYPVCVGGKRACPPEDCGGVPGYEEIISADGDDKKEFIDWLGYEFDPEAFTVEWANERLNDPDCCRKGYTVEDLAGMAGKTPATIKKWVKKLEDNELRDYLWKYKGKTLLLDPEGVPVLYSHLR